MHILVLTDRDWTHPQGGGTGTNLYGQVRCWLADDHQVSIIACGYPGARLLERHHGLTIHRLGGRLTVFPRAIWSQAKDLVRNADVVLEIVNGITFLTPLWLRLPRVALIHHVHRQHYLAELGPIGRFPAWALETTPLTRLYRDTKFITVSSAGAEEIARLGIPPAQIVINHNGVDLDGLRPGERAPEPTILYLGRLKRYKRIEWLLDAVGEIPEAQLHIAGEGDHRPQVERAIAARGLESRVFLHGFVDEATKLALLQRAWVNVTASSTEGWCLTVMEAAACGTPSVATAAGGLPEAIRADQTGLLAADQKMLTAQIQRVLRDSLLRERLGTAALERARGFSWQATADRTLTVLESQLTQRARTIVLPGSGRFRRGGATPFEDPVLVTSDER